MKFAMKIVGILCCFILFSKEVSAEQQKSTPKRKVSINKCCRLGDVLDRDGTTCSIGIGSKNWAPKVYYPKAGTFHQETGTLPGHMAGSVIEDVRPSCRFKDLLNSSDVFLVGNGSLYLHNKHQMINKFEDFCVDQQFSIVCRHDKESVPDNISVVELTKCCGLKSFIPPKTHQRHLA